MPHYVMLDAAKATVLDALTAPFPPAGDGWIEADDERAVGRWGTPDGGKTFQPPAAPVPPPVDLRAYAASARYAKETAGITVGTAPVATDRDAAHPIDAVIADALWMTRNAVAKAEARATAAEADAARLRAALTVAASRMGVAAMDWGCAYATGSDKLTHADDMTDWAKEARAALRPAGEEGAGPADCRVPPNCPSNSNAPGARATAGEAEHG